MAAVHIVVIPDSPDEKITAMDIRMLVQRVRDSFLHNVSGQVTCHPGDAFKLNGGYIEVVGQEWKITGILKGD